MQPSPKYFGLLLLCRYIVIKSRPGLSISRGFKVKALDNRNNKIKNPGQEWLCVKSVERRWENAFAALPLRWENCYITECIYSTAVPYHHLCSCAAETVTACSSLQST